MLLRPRGFTPTATPLPSTTLFRSSSVRLAVAPHKAQQAKSWAYSDFGKAGTVVSVGKPDLLGATTYTFANGVKLTVKQVDFNKNSISIGLLTGIGERNFSPDRVDPRYTALGAVVSGGLGKMTIDEASRALNGHLIGASLATLGQRFLLSGGTRPEDRSEEHTSELQSLMRISYDVFCLKKKKPTQGYE